MCGYPFFLSQIFFILFLIFSIINFLSLYFFTMFSAIICFMREALYRKYRPHTFADVVGQDHIVKVLEASVASGDISHAYLFAGTRGTGKTSVARIFAKAIGTTPNDILEIDAASNNLVEDMRSLNESVHTLPFESKYKVYILDEVHMLSKSAANAFLKTLEEPPPHVVFILATTELHKIPETILSRCQSFAFKKPSQEMLQKVVITVAQKEGYEIDSASAELIALLGDGSFRDTLGILDKVLAYSAGGTQEHSQVNKIAHKKISEDAARVITGAPSVDLVHDIISAIALGDLHLGLSTTQRTTEQNIDMSVFIKLILHSARAVLLVRFGAADVIRKDLSENEFIFVSELAKSATESDAFSSQTLVLLLTAYEKTQGAYIQSLPLELALIEIIGKGSGKEFKKV